MTDVGTVAYLSGPMRQIPYSNFPLFIAVTSELREAGYIVLSPVEHALELGFDARTMSREDAPDVRELLAWDCNAILSSDTLIYMQGWQESSGCRAELALAKAANIPSISLLEALTTMLGEECGNHG